MDLGNYYPASGPFLLMLFCLFFFFLTSLSHVLLYVHSLLINVWIGVGKITELKLVVFPNF